jgi:hypothetical protein
MLERTLLDGCNALQFSLGQVIHTRGFCLTRMVNNSQPGAEKPAIYRSLLSSTRFPVRVQFVNKGVYKFSLSVWKILIRCGQFIERTEMGGSNQQVEVDRLKDNPR